MAIHTGARPNGGLGVRQCTPRTVIHGVPARGTVKNPLKAQARPGQSFPGAIQQAPVSLGAAARALRCLDGCRGRSPPAVSFLGLTPLSYAASPLRPALNLHPLHPLFSLPGMSPHQGAVL